MKIIHEREKCIGCGACVAICPKFWEMKDDNKSHLIGSSLSPEGNEELTINENEISCNQEAADSCPVSIIHIEK